MAFIVFFSVWMTSEVTAYILCLIILFSPFHLNVVRKKSVLNVQLYAVETDFLLISFPQSP